MNRCRKRRSGFTLLEIIIVVGLMAALAGVLFKFLFGTSEGAEREVAKLFFQTVSTPLQTYKLNMGSYPNNSQGLGALVTRPGDGGSNWAGPYVEDTNSLKDPWGFEYRYRYPAQRSNRPYDIWSVGPDGQDGTADDVGNW